MTILAQATGNPVYIMVFYMVIIFGSWYFLSIKPAKKREEEKSMMLSKMEIGDSVITTSGFIGVVIDIDNEQNVVVIEFGKNKNCRIPVKKEYIQYVEKN